MVPGGGVLTVVLTVGVMMPYSMRVQHAIRLRWECDGVIVEKYQSRNHAALTLVIQNNDGRRTTFENVDRGLWERAALKDRLRKRRGETAGELNGRRVEVVPAFR